MTPTHEVAWAALPAMAAPIYGIASYMANRRRTRGSSLAFGRPLAAGLRLRRTDGRVARVRDLVGRHATVFVFMSNRCPGVKAYDSRLAGLARDFKPLGVRFVGVNSVPENLYPSESVAGMAEAASERGLVFDYLKDETQTLKRALGAVCTPQVFLLDGQRRLRYRGRVDDAFLEERVRTHDLRNAIAAVLENRSVQVPETHAIGCAIDDASQAAMVVERPAAPRAVGV